MRSAMAESSAAVLGLGGFEGQIFDDVVVVVLEFSKQAFVCEIERTGILPVVAQYIMDALDDAVVADLDGELAAAVEAAGRKIDGADDRALAVGHKHFGVKLDVLELVDLYADIPEDAQAADAFDELVFFQLVGRPRHDVHTHTALFRTHDV